MPMKSLKRGLLVREMVVLAAGGMPGDPMAGGSPWDWPHEEYRKVAATMKQVFRSCTGVLFWGLDWAVKLRHLGEWARFSFCG